MKNPEDHIKYYKLSETEPTKWRCNVLYADTGKRKTTTACSMSDNNLLISADESWEVLQKPIHKDLYDKTTIVFYEGLSQLRYLDFEPYDHLILDTHTKMVDMYLDLLLEKGKWTKGTGYREQLMSNDPELEGTTIVAGIDYRAARDKWRPAIANLVKAPIHVTFLMHVNHPNPGFTNDLTKRPRLSPAIWDIVAEYAGIIGYIQGGNKGVFKIGVDESAAAYVGKSRVEGIQGNMDLDSFVKKYRETLPS